LGIAPIDSGKTSMIIQCKHTQGGTRIGRGAVEEVLRADIYYPELPAPRRLVVVSNGIFDKAAIALASSSGVKLFDRSDVSQGLYFDSL